MFVFSFLLFIGNHSNSAGFAKQIKSLLPFGQQKKKTSKQTTINNTSTRLSK